MQATNSNKKSLNTQTSVPGDRPMAPEVREVFTQIESMASEGAGIEEVIYKIMSQGVDPSVMSSALEHLGFTPDAVVDLFQKVELLEKEMLAQQQAQAQPQDFEQPQQPMMPQAPMGEQQMSPEQLDMMAQEAGQQLMQSEAMPSMAYGGSGNRGLGPFLGRPNDIARPLYLPPTPRRGNVLGAAFLLDDAAGQFFGNTDRNKDGLMDGTFKDWNAKMARYKGKQNLNKTFEVDYGTLDPSNYVVNFNDFSEGKIRTKDQYVKDLGDRSALNFNPETNKYSGYFASNDLESRMIGKNQKDKNAIALSEFINNVSDLDKTDREMMAAATTYKPGSGLGVDRTSYTEQGRTPEEVEKLRSEYRDLMLGKRAMVSFDRLNPMRYGGDTSLPKAQLGIPVSAVAGPVLTAASLAADMFNEEFPVPDQTLRNIGEPPSSAFDKLGPLGKNFSFGQQDYKNQTNLDEAYNFAARWMSSPRYKQMLKNSGGTDWWTDEEDVAQARINNLNQIQTVPYYISDDPNHNYTQKQLSGIAGYSRSSDGSIYVNPSSGADMKTLYDHEVSHSVDRPIGDNNSAEDYIKFYGRGRSKEPRLIPSKDVELITNLIDHSIPQDYTVSFWDKYGDTPEEGTRNYLGDPSEVRARLGEIRRTLNDKGVDVFNNEITPDDFNKVLKNEAVQDLRALYSDDNIMKLLNTISSVDNNVDSMPYAKLGGQLPKAQYGGRGDLEGEYETREEYIESFMPTLPRFDGPFRAVGNIINGLGGGDWDYWDDYDRTLDKETATLGALLTSPKNWIWTDDDGYEPLPNYNQYANKDEAFAAARKNLGKGKSFLYEGTRYTTNYKDEAPNNETEEILNRVTKDLSDEETERFREVWQRAGQPPLTFGLDDEKYSIPAYDAGWLDFASGSNRRRPHVNLINRDNKVYLGWEGMTDEKARENILDELSHNMQIRRDGTGASLIRFGTGGLREWLNPGYEPYDDINAFEGEAHEVIEPQLSDFVNNGGKFPELKYGAELPKAQMIGEFDPNNPYGIPDFSQMGQTSYINPDTGMPYTPGPNIDAAANEGDLTELDEAAVILKPKRIESIPIEMPDMQLAPINLEQYKSTSTDVASMGEPKVTRKRSVGNALKQGETFIKDNPYMQAYGDVSNLAVMGANLANEFFAEKEYNDYRNKLRNSTNADNIYSAVVDPINQRGTFDTNTGLAEPDNLVDYYMQGKYGREMYKTGGDFSPHMMYDPKTGKGYKANALADHIRMADMGYLHKDEMGYGGELEVDNDTLAALIAAGADIEML